MAEVVVRRTLRQPPPQVWAVLSDHGSMATWLPLRRSDLGVPGATTRDGVGAVRALHLVGPAVREQVTAFDPPHRLAYQLLSGIPVVRDYTGEVVLTPTTTGGTDLVWTVRFRPLVPAAAVVVRLVIGRTADGLVKAVARS